MEAHERNKHTLNCDVNVGWDVGFTRGNTDDGDDEFADTRTNRTDEKKTATADTIDGLNTDKDYGGAHHRDNDGDNECVSDTSTLEERGTVVDDEVDTGELLETLKHDASPRAESVSAAVVAEVVDVDAGTQSTFSFKCLRNQVSSHRNKSCLIINSPVQFRLLRC